MSITCPTCGADAADEATHCPQCGESVLRTCAVCGKSASVESEWYQSTKTGKIVCGDCYQQMMGEPISPNNCCYQLSEGDKAGWWTKGRVVKIGLGVIGVFVVFMLFFQSPAIFEDFIGVMFGPDVEIVGDEQLVTIDSLEVMTQVFTSSKITDSWKTVKYGFDQQGVSFNEYDQGRIMISGNLTDLSNAAVNVTVTVFFENEQEEVVHMQELSTFAYLESIPVSFSYYFDERTREEVVDATMFIEAYPLWY